MALHVIREGDRRPPITDRQFKELILSNEISRGTQWVIRSATHNGDYAIPPLYHEIALLGSRRRAAGGVHYGFCHTMGIAEPKTEALVVSSEFATYLAGLPELAETNRGVRTAAVYARALDVVQGALKTVPRNNASYPRQRGFEATFNQRFWDRRLAARPALPYRAAGLIALQWANLDDIDIPESPPYPPHIAGLMNPLPAKPEAGKALYGFDMLSGLLKKHAHLSGE